MDKNKKLFEFVDASEGRLRSRKKIRSSESKLKGKKTLKYRLDSVGPQNPIPDIDRNVASVAGQHITFFGEVASASTGDGAATCSWVDAKPQERTNEARRISLARKVPLRMPQQFLQQEKEKRDTISLSEVNGVSGSDSDHNDGIDDWFDIVSSNFLLFLITL